MTISVLPFSVLMPGLWKMTTGHFLLVNWASPKAPPLCLSSHWAAGVGVFSALLRLRTPAGSPPAAAVSGGGCLDRGAQQL